MSDILDKEDNRLVKIVSKVRGSKPKPKTKSKPKSKSKAKKGKRSSRGLLSNDAAGIKSKAELGDDLQDKKIVNNPPKAEKPINPVKKGDVRYQRINGLPEESTVEPLAYELENDMDLILKEEKPISNEFGMYSMARNLEQGIIWDNI